MTKEEFEKQYAARSHMTVERLHELSRHAEPCNCGDESCQGWQMTHKSRPLPLYAGAHRIRDFDDHPIDEATEGETQ